MPRKPESPDRRRLSVYAELLAIFALAVCLLCGICGFVLAAIAAPIAASNCFLLAAAAAFVVLVL